MSNPRPKNPQKINHNSANLSPEDKKTANTEAIFIPFEPVFIPNDEDSNEAVFIPNEALVSTPQPVDPEKDEHFFDSDGFATAVYKDPVDDDNFFESDGFASAVYKDPVDDDKFFESDGFAQEAQRFAKPKPSIGSTHEILKRTCDKPTLSIMVEQKDFKPAINIEPPVNGVIIKWVENGIKKEASHNFTHFDDDSIRELLTRFKKDNAKGMQLEKINLSQCKPALNKHQKQKLDKLVNEFNLDSNYPVKITSGKSMWDSRAKAKFEETKENVSEITPQKRGRH